MIKDHDEKIDNRQDIKNTNVPINIGSPQDFETVPLLSNEEGKLNQGQVSIALEDSNNAPTDSIEEPNLAIINTITDIRADPGSIVGYAHEPLLPLEKACEPLAKIVHNISLYVRLALDETPKLPPDGLTIDESAAIRLYTIQWEEPDQSLHTLLNHTLRTGSRDDLRPYFKYMKLFLTALVKLPCLPLLVIWRGVKKNLSAEYVPGATVTWWAFSTCTTKITTLENNMYLGATGNRTLFSVLAINGRSIRAHSHFVDQDEILLLPGTRMIVQSQFNPSHDLHIVHLQQVIPEEVLLEPPFANACLYPKIKRHRLYRKKRFVIPICLLIILIIVAVIMGFVFGTRSTKINEPMTKLPF